MSTIKSSKSFSRLLEEGMGKEELKARFALSEEQYQRVVACVEHIKKSK